NHPPEHLSFAQNHPGKKLYEQIDLDGLPQVLWPVHCVAGTPGAEFHPALERDRITRVFAKGTDARIDSYSGFFDNGHRKATGLGDYLKQQGVTRVFVLGLATDYCVKWTALDALRLGFTAHLVEDGCRGVGLAPDDVPGALKALREAGVRIESSAALTV
ncbi:MAG TPA: bifunctional nicotinamidase/pyrazinamidase, partial [Polyangiales bacterium]